MRGMVEASERFSDVVFEDMGDEGGPAANTFHSRTV